MKPSLGSLEKARDPGPPLDLESGGRREGRGEARSHHRSFSEVAQAPATESCMGHLLTHAADPAPRECIKAPMQPLSAGPVAQPPIQSHEKEGQRQRSIKVQTGGSESTSGLARKIRKTLLEWCEQEEAWSCAPSALRPLSEEKWMPSTASGGKGWGGHHYLLLVSFFTALNSGQLLSWTNSMHRKGLGFLDHVGGLLFGANSPISQAQVGQGRQALSPKKLWKWMHLTQSTLTQVLENPTGYNPRRKIRPSGIFWVRGEARPFQKGRLEPGLVSLLGKTVNGHATLTGYQMPAVTLPLDAWLSLGINDFQWGDSVEVDGAYWVPSPRVSGLLWWVQTERPAFGTLLEQEDLTRTLQALYDQNPRSSLVRLARPEAGTVPDLNWIQVPHSSWERLGFHGLRSDTYVQLQQGFAMPWTLDPPTTPIVQPQAGPGAGAWTACGPFRPHQGRQIGNPSLETNSTETRLQGTAHPFARGSHPPRMGDFFRAGPLFVKWEALPRQRVLAIPRQAWPSLMCTDLREDFSVVMDGRMYPPASPYEASPAILEWLHMLYMAGSGAPMQHPENVLSWNMGPHGFNKAGPLIDHLFAENRPVICLQDLRIPSSQTSIIQVKASIENKFPYKVFISVSKQKSKQDYPFSVLTALHSEVFSGATSIRGGAPPGPGGAQTDSTAGRILALNANLKTGGSLRIVNLYQFTANALAQQARLWSLVRPILCSTSSDPTIMVGDMNGAMPDTHHATGIRWTNAGKRIPTDCWVLQLPGLETLLKNSPLVTHDEWGELNPAVGLRWEVVGLEPPGRGTDIRHPGLIKALKRSLDLSETLLTELDLPELKLTDYVQVRGLFLQPSQTRSPPSTCVVQVGDSYFRPARANQRSGYSRPLGWHLQYADSMLAGVMTQAPGTWTAADNHTWRNFRGKAATLDHVIARHITQQGPPRTRWMHFPQNALPGSARLKFDHSQLLVTLDPTILPPPGPPGHARSNTQRFDPVLFKTTQGLWSKKARELFPPSESREVKSGEDLYDQHTRDCQRLLQIALLLQEKARRLLRRARERPPRRSKQQTLIWKEIHLLTTALHEAPLVLANFDAPIRRATQIVFDMVAPGTEAADKHLLRTTPWWRELLEAEISRRRDRLSQMGTEQDRDDTRKLQYRYSWLFDNAVKGVKRVMGKFNQSRPLDTTKQRCPNGVAWKVAQEVAEQEIRDWAGTWPLDQSRLSLCFASGTVSVTVHQLSDLLPLIRAVNNGGTPPGLSEFRLEYSNGPWSGPNLITALETFFQTNAYNPFATCEFPDCRSQKKTPLSALGGADSSRQSDSDNPHLRKEHDWLVDEITAKMATLCLDDLSVPPEPARRDQGPGTRQAGSQWTEQHHYAKIPPQHPPLRRRLVNFCAHCMRESDFRHNKDEIRPMQFLQQAGIFQHRTIPLNATIRGEVTRKAFGRFLARLAPRKACGIDGIPAEILKNSPAPFRENLRHLINRILKSEFRLPKETLMGVITLIHKKGDPELLSNYRPIALLTSTYQLINIILAERIQSLAEKHRLLESSQFGFRWLRGVPSSAQKQNLLFKLASASDGTLIRIDLDMTNAFNAAGHACLWAILEHFGVPDIDLLKSFYEWSHMTVKVDDTLTADITMDTGTAQGSALSPLLFILMINALLRLLDKTGIQHGVKGAPGFNHLAFADDLSLYVGSERDANRLLELVKKFEEWSGLCISLKKSFVTGVLHGRGAQMRMAESKAQLRTAQAKNEASTTKSQPLENLAWDWDDEENPVRLAPPSKTPTIQCKHCMKGRPKHLFPSYGSDSVPTHGICVECSSRWMPSGIRYGAQLLPVIPGSTPTRFLGIHGDMYGNCSDQFRHVFTSTAEILAFIRTQKLNDRQNMTLISMTLPAFLRASGGLVKWPKAQLLRLDRMWMQAYRLANRLPPNTPACLFRFPAQIPTGGGGGMQVPTPLAVLTLATWQHLETCCRYDDGTKALMEAEYRAALAEFHCGDLRELQEALALMDCTWQQSLGNSFVYACYLSNVLDLKVKWHPFHQDSIWSTSSLTLAKTLSGRSALLHLPGFPQDICFRSGIVREEEGVLPLWSLDAAGEVKVYLAPAAGLPELITVRDVVELNFPAIRTLAQLVHVLEGGRLCDFGRDGQTQPPRPSHGSKSGGDALGAAATLEGSLAPGTASSGEPVAGSPQSTECNRTGLNQAMLDTQAENGWHEAIEGRAEAGSPIEEEESEEGSHDPAWDYADTDMHGEAQLDTQAVNGWPAAASGRAKAGSPIEEEEPGAGPDDLARGYADTDRHGEAIGTTSSDHYGLESSVGPPASTPCEESVRGLSPQPWENQDTRVLGQPTGVSWLAATKGLKLERDKLETQSKTASCTLSETQAARLLFLQQAEQAFTRLLPKLEARSFHTLDSLPRSPRGRGGTCRYYFWLPSLPGEAPAALQMVSEWLSHRQIKDWASLPALAPPLLRTIETWMTPAPALPKADPITSLQQVLNKIPRLGSREAAKAFWEEHCHLPPRGTRLPFSWEEVGERVREGLEAEDWANRLISISLSMGSSGPALPHDRRTAKSPRGAAAAPTASAEDMGRSLILQVTRHRPGITGLRWISRGRKRPTGTEVHCPRLSQALRSSAFLSPEARLGLGALDLMPDSFIRVPEARRKTGAAGDIFFQPRPESSPASTQFLCELKAPSPDRLERLLSLWRQGLYLQLEAELLRGQDLILMPRRWWANDDRYECPHSLGWWVRCASTSSVRECALCHRMTDTLHLRPGDSICQDCQGEDVADSDKGTGQPTMSAAFGWNPNSNQSESPSKTSSQGSDRDSVSSHDDRGGWLSDDDLGLREEEGPTSLEADAARVFPSDQPDLSDSEHSQEWWWDQRELESDDDIGRAPSLPGRSEVTSGTGVTQPGPTGIRRARGRGANGKPSPRPLSEEKARDILRGFDAMPSFGPAVGRSRQARIRRATSLNPALRPPSPVAAALRTYPHLNTDMGLSAPIPTSVRSATERGNRCKRRRLRVPTHEKELTGGGRGQTRLTTFLPPLTEQSASALLDGIDLNPLLGPTDPDSRMRRICRALATNPSLEAPRKALKALELFPHLDAARPARDKLLGPLTLPLPQIVFSVPPAAQMPLSQGSSAAVLEALPASGGGADCRRRTGSRKLVQTRLTPLPPSPSVREPLEQPAGGGRGEKEEDEPLPPEAQPGLQSGRDPNPGLQPLRRSQRVASRAHLITAEEQFPDEVGNKRPAHRPSGTRKRSRKATREMRAMVFRTAEPALLETENAGDTPLSFDQLGECLAYMQELETQVGDSTAASSVPTWRHRWYTTAELGFPLLDDEYARDLHPEIRNYAVHAVQRGDHTLLPLLMFRGAEEDAYCEICDQTVPRDQRITCEVCTHTYHAGCIGLSNFTESRTLACPDCCHDLADQSEGPEVLDTPEHAPRSDKPWEKFSTPFHARDPDILPECPAQGPDLLSVIRSPPLAGYVCVQTEPIITERVWHGTTISCCEGVARFSESARSWEMEGARWHFLASTAGQIRGPDLLPFVENEISRQTLLDKDPEHHTYSWTVLRAAKQIFGATRFQGGSAITAPPFFEEAGRGASHFWSFHQGGPLSHENSQRRGPVVISLPDFADTDVEADLWDLQATRDWVVLTPPLDEDSIKSRLLSKCGELLAEDKDKAGRTHRFKGWWRTGDDRLASHGQGTQCWIAKTAEPVPPEARQALQQALSFTGGADPPLLANTPLDSLFRQGTEAGLLGLCKDNVKVIATDGSVTEGRMWAGVYTVWTDSSLSAQVGREEEGATTLRVEEGALYMGLAEHRDIEEPLFILSDSKNSLTQIEDWVGEGKRPTLANVDDADIVRAILEILTHRVSRGFPTFLLKIRAHRGEPYNEASDRAAGTGKTDENTPLIWNTASGRPIFSIPRTHLSEEAESDRHSACMNDAIKKHVKLAAACMDLKPIWKKSGPTEAFLRETNYSRELLSACYSDSLFPGPAKRRLLQAVGNVFPCRALLHLYGAVPSPLCPHCGEYETYGHIQSRCSALEVPRTAAHHSIWREVLLHIKQNASKEWSFPRSANGSQHSELSIQQILLKHKFFSSAQLLLQKVHEFVGNNTRRLSQRYPGLALGGTQDVSDLDEAQLLKVRHEVRFSQITLENTVLRASTEEETQRTIKSFCDLRPDVNLPHLLQPASALQHCLRVPAGRR